MKTRKHWFFDFDGTLCDTELDIRIAWLETIKALGRECPRFNEVYKIGPTLEELAYKLFDDCTPQLVEDIKEQFRTLYDASSFVNSKPYPWVQEWLDGLKGDGCKIYIATNKRWRPMAKLMPLLKWDKYFDGYYSFDMLTEQQDMLVVPELVGKKLKKCELLRTVMKSKNISPDDAVMVGDTIVDVTAGLEAGLYTIGCTWGYGEASELKGANEIYDMGRFSK